MQQITSRLLVLCIVLFISSCGATKIAQVEVSNYELDSNLTGSAEIEKQIAPFRKSLEKRVNEIIGENEFLLLKEKPESTLGNFMSDAILEIVHKKTGEQIDFAVVNYGGIRIPELPAGPLTVGKMFELMPFENLMVILDLDLATTKLLFGRMQVAQGWPVSKQIQMKMDTLNHTYNVTYNGVPLEKKQRYKVLISDYIANGGDDCDFLIGKKRETLDYLLRDALIDFVEEQTKAGEKISWKKEGRMSYE